MRLRRLEVRGLARLPDRAFEFGAAPIVYVTGGPASGKTALLETIIAGKESIGAYGSAPRGHALLRSDVRAGHIDMEWSLSESEQKEFGSKTPILAARVLLGDGARVRPDHPSPLADLLRRYDHVRRHGKMDYFPDNRALPPGPSPQYPSVMVEALERSRRLAREPGKYNVTRGFIEALLVDDAVRGAELARSRGAFFATDGGGQAEALRGAIARFGLARRLDGVDRLGPSGSRVRFVNAHGAAVDLDDLSSSEKDAVLFAASFVRLGHESSVVLIDTPELWQHPQRVKAFVDAISSLGANNQIIAATTSSELLASAPPDAVVRL